MREQTIKGATIREKMLSQTAQNSSFFDIFATALQTLNYWDARPLGTGNWLYTTWQCIKKLETKSICKGDAITEKNIKIRRNTSMKYIWRCVIGSDWRRRRFEPLHTYLTPKHLQNDTFARQVTYCRGSEDFSRTLERRFKQMLKKQERTCCFC